MLNDEYVIKNFYEEQLVKHYDKLLEEYDIAVTNDLAVKDKEKGDMDVLTVDVCYELQLFGMDDNYFILSEELLIRYKDAE